MNPWMQVPDGIPGRFQIGDTVRAKYTWRGVVGEIIEDYGDIGKPGRRLYTVRWKTDDEPELPYAEEDLEPVPG